MINLALLLRRWERSVIFLPVDHFGFLAFGQCFRFISREKAFPIFISQFRIFGQLSFDHKCFDVVDWMNIFHGFFNYSSNLLQNEDGYKKNCINQTKHQKHKPEVLYEVLWQQQCCPEWECNNWSRVPQLSTLNHWAQEDADDVGRIVPDCSPCPLFWLYRKHFHLQVFSQPAHMVQIEPVTWSCRALWLLCRGPMFCEWLPQSCFLQSNQVRL